MKWLVGAALALAAWTSAGTIATAAEVEIQAPGPSGPLKGALATTADAHAPVVLIIPGSGPTDRDGNNPLGVAASSYRLLAEGLAQRGVASVRIDKRGMFSSAAAVRDPNDVTIGAYADDVQAWVKAIRARTGAPCVWVLGHSEGGLVALAAGGRPEGICGLLLVSAPGRPLGDILREQLRANPANAPLLPPAEAAITALEAGRRIDVAGMHPALQRLFAPAVQGFLIDMLSRDPARLAAAYGGPILILQGDKDLQVSLADARRLKQAQPRADLIVLPGVNHVLKQVASDDPAANIATYRDPNAPLAPGVVESIAAFVQGARSGPVETARRGR